MKKILIVAMALVASTSSAFANTACSDSSGYYQYKVGSYVKGIPPERGDLLRKIQILVGGALISESRYYEGLNPVWGPVSAAFSDERVIRHESTSTGETKIYSAMMTLKRNPAGGFPNAELPVSEYVICKEVAFWVP